MKAVDRMIVRLPCIICGAGARDRPDALWVNTERLLRTRDGNDPKLLCSFCIGDAVKALAASIPDEESDESESPATGGVVLVAAS